MLTGITMFTTDRTIAVHELALAAEERGFHSVFIPEHTHIPVSRETPPATGGETLDPSYMRTLDPLIALASAASVTRSIRLGTAVSLPAEHDPIAWAKSVATLDHISNGRVTLGVGFGWNREELRDHGVAYEERREVVRESVLLAQALWSSEVAEFSGSYHRLPASWSWPKPIQQPRVRTLLGGGAGPKIFAHIAEWCDGWIPFGGSGLAESLPKLRQVVLEAGRDPETIHVVPMGVLPSTPKMEHYRSLGVTECVLRVPAGTRDEVLPVLDQLADLARN